MSPTPPPSLRLLLTLAVRQTQIQSKFLWRWLPPVSKSSQEHFWMICSLDIWSLRLPDTVRKLKWCAPLVNGIQQTQTNFILYPNPGKQNAWGVFQNNVHLWPFFSSLCWNITEELRTEAKPYLLDTFVHFKHSFWKEGHQFHLTIN